MDHRPDDEPVEAWEATGPGDGEDGDPPVEARTTDVDAETIVESDHVDEGIDENDQPVDPSIDDDDPPDRFNRVRRSTAGAMMTGIAIGFQQVFDRPKQDIPFVIKASSDPDDPDNPINLQFDPDDPTKTVAIIRTAVPKVESASDGYSRPVSPPG